MKDARSGRPVYRAGHLNGSRNVIQKSMQFGRGTARGNCARAGPQDSRHASHPFRRGGRVYAKDPREDRLESPPFAKTSDDPSGNASVQELPESHDTVLCARQQLKAALDFSLGHPPIELQSLLGACDPRHSSGWIILRATQPSKWFVGSSSSSDWFVRNEGLGDDVESNEGLGDDAGYVPGDESRLAILLLRGSSPRRRRSISCR